MNENKEHSMLSRVVAVLGIIGLIVGFTVMTLYYYGFFN